MSKPLQKLEIKKPDKKPAKPGRRAEPKNQGPRPVSTITLVNESKNKIKPKAIPPSQAKARPSRAIDWDILKDMVRVGCNIEECAGRFGITKQSLREQVMLKYSKAWIVFEQENFMTTLHRLRTVQFQAAFGYSRKGQDGRVYEVKPDTQMQIHLGKQYLGQSEKLDIKTLFQGYIIENEKGEVEDADYEEMEGVLDGVPRVNLDDYEEDPDINSLHE